jgi:hypothetical protein
MRRGAAILGGIALVGLSLWILWFVGIVFEFEYPYTLTLARVRQAKSADGTPISKIITADVLETDGGLRWHTCNYCAHWCGNHNDLVSVRLEAPGKRAAYHFAYSHSTRTLVPMTDAAAAQFPLLLPSGDTLTGINQLNRKPGVFTVGQAELKLPEKWFGKVTASD